MVQVSDAEPVKINEAVEWPGGIISVSVSVSVSVSAGGLIGTVNFSWLGRLARS